MRQLGGKSAPFAQAIKKPVYLGPEYNAWYWNPNRASIQFAPDWFRLKLRELDGHEDLSVTWNPITERWQVWTRAPKIVHKICSGWRLLFIHNGPKGEYLPLDERVLARLYWSSAAAYGDGKRYFQAIQREMERDKEAAERKSLQDTIDAAMPSWEHSQIKNIGKGSKFATYHS